MSVYIARKKDGTPKSPYYQFDFVLKINGERRRFHGSTGEKTEKAAKRWEDRERERVRSEKPGDTMTLSQGCYRYDQERGQHLASGDDLAKAFEHCCRLLGGARRLANITSDDIAKAVHRRQAETVGKRGARLVTAATVNRQIVEPMRRLMLRARRTWGVSCEPDLIDWAALRQKEAPGRVREFTADEGIAFWQVLRADYQPLVAFLAIRGFRVRAAIGMQKFDFDSQRQCVIAHKKGVGPVRHTLTPEQCDIILQEMRKAPDSKAIWTYEVQRRRGARLRGQRLPITYSGLRRVLANALAAAGIADFHIHDLRHDFASKMLRHCRDVTKVQKALGHSDIQSTMRYAHVLDEDVRDAMSGMSVPELHRNHGAGLTSEEPNVLKVQRKTK